RHERGEGEPPAALHHLGDAVDVDHVLLELGLALTASTAPAATTVPTAATIVATAATALLATLLSALLLISSHASPLELEAALAGAFGEGLHTAVIEIAATIEDDPRHAGLLRPF